MAKSVVANKMVKRTEVEQVWVTEEERQGIFTKVVEFYHSALKKNDKALWFLKQRGLVHPDLIDRFQLGFCDRTLGAALPDRRTDEGSRIRKQLAQVGLTQKSGHEVLIGCLTVPLFGENGEVRGLVGRRIAPRKGAPVHVSVTGVEPVFFNPAGVVSGEVIVCTSPVEALSFWVCGFENGVSWPMEQALTDEALDLLVRHSVKRVTIALPSGEVWDNRAAELVETLNRVKIQCYRCRFPDEMDANETLCSEATPGAREEVLRRSLVAAEWVSGSGSQGVSGSGNQVTDGEKAKTEAADLSESERESRETKGVKIEGNEEGEQKQDQERELSEISKMIKESILDEEEDRERSERIEAVENSGSEERPNEIPVENVAGVSVEERGNEIRVAVKDLLFRVRGLDRNRAVDVLRVNIRVSLGDTFHLDTFDLYQSRPRFAFIERAAEELEVEKRVVKRALGQVLLVLEEIQNERMEAGDKTGTHSVVVEDEAAAEALELLRQPDLMERIVDDFETCGVMGEAANCLVGYLAGVSRKLDDPLAVMVQSSSSAGKSTLMESILSFFPEEEQVRYTAVTGQSLFYMGTDALVHKILAVSEEEGAERAEYAIKTLQSEGSLRIATTGKDPKSGRLETQEYRVKGPVQLMMTTTRIDLNEELLNRCLVLTVNESTEQTRAVHRRQRLMKTKEGVSLRLKRERVLTLHRNAQRLLKPLVVVNPYAKYLSFPSRCLRLRRDHMKYLSLIDAIALLHQHQRDIKTGIEGDEDLEYIEVELSDIEAANRLACEVLGRSLDELTPQSRNLLSLVTHMVKEKAVKSNVPVSEVRFTRKQIRNLSGWSNTQVHTHIRLLTELEYLHACRGVSGQGFAYELVFGCENESDRPTLAGLTDIRSLRKRVKNESPRRYCR